MAVFKKLVRSAEGAHVPHHKNTENLETVQMPVPSRVVIPMKMHIGAPATLCVKKGTEVKVGDLLGKANGFISANIHSSVSGKVASIDEIVMTDGSKVQAVVIDTDGLQTISENVKAPEVVDHASFVQAIKDSGLVGQGGAGFPTGAKLAPQNLDEVHTLIINAAECEPYITVEYRRMMEHGDQIVEGAKIVKQYLGLSKVIIGIESNKPKAVAKMKGLIEGLEGFSVVELPSVYPQGAEKIIIEKTTGIEVPQGALPAQVGCIVMNVCTTAFIYRYMQTGMPLVTKKLTIDGDAVKEPKNVEVVVGTTIKDVVEFCGGYAQEPGKIIYGGPMMGIAVSDDTMPITKQNNAVVIFGKEQAVLPEINPCIRCGRCINACPMGISPVEISLALSVNDGDELKALYTDLCMECGSCSFVCPARRPVTQTMKEAKEFLRKAAK